jgi:hypothetical protein
VVIRLPVTSVSPDSCKRNKQRTLIFFDVALPTFYQSSSAPVTTSYTAGPVWITVHHEVTYTDENGLSPGTIAGIAIGVSAFVAIITGLARIYNTVRLARIRRAALGYHS